MKIQSIKTVYFSATGNTKNVVKLIGETIARNMNLSYKEIDFTLPQAHKDSYEFTKEELASRYEIKLENYVKTIGIEARTLAEMITKDFLPAVSTYAAEVSKNATAKKSFMAAADTASEEALVEKLSTAYTALTAEVTELKTLIDTSFALEDTQKCAEAFHDQVLAKMEDIRTVASDIEALIPDSILSYPTYDQLLFSL